MHDINSTHCNTKRWKNLIKTWQIKIDCINYSYIKLMLRFGNDLIISKQGKIIFLIPVGEILINEPDLYQKKEGTIEK